MLILFLLVAMFIVGMGIMSYLNLTESKKIVSQVRLEQIEETFYANLGRINAQNDLMKKNAEDIANMGEMFHRMKQRSGEDYREDIKSFLLDKTGNFPEAFGSGLWFEPNIYEEQSVYFGPYAYWHKNNVVFTWEYSNASYDYHRRDWYRAAIPEGWDVNRQRPENFYWTAANYDPVLDAVVIKLNALMLDDEERIIGVATTDWGLDEITGLISGVNVTENTHAFLIDEKNRKFASGLQKELLVPQPLLDALSYKDLAGVENPEDFIEADNGKPRMGRKAITVEDREYSLFFAKAKSKLIFVISVPKDEIYAVIERMKKINFQIVGITVFIVFALSAVILYIVAGIMRLLDTLYTDSLTGLPNRTKLLQDIGRQKHAALLIINLDSFKEINDFFGQKHGDAVLKAFAKCFSAFIAYNAKGLSCVLTLYKLPADEYSVLVKNHVEKTELKKFIEKLSSFASAQVFSIENQQVALNATLGVARDGENGEPSEETENILLSCASIALKLAKSRRKHYLIYDDKYMRVRETYEQNITWANIFKKALENDRIIPFFQPIVNNSTGAVEKFECLARLIDETNTIASPGCFLNIAKKLRLYHQITKIMVEKSFAAHQDLEYEISINLSYEDIADPDTASFIKEKLSQYGIAKRVCFEILESECIHNYKPVSAFIKSVKQMGCKISIDDFGTGYSNFEHLLRLNVDIIKIDGSLIKNIDKDPTALIVSQGIVNFARNLNMKTIAEFVHSQAVLDKVVEIGVDYSQGYCIGPPGPMHE
ncbi:MAG: EAL domain-containing protein [Gammaproteobacteria bacterium]|nr:EAL domain-containing protein [Gammaproteobacteria bacterium]